MESQNASVWNATHTAEILSTEETGLQLKVGDIKAFLPKEELLFLHGPLGESLEIYLENPKHPTASILKAQELAEIEAVTQAIQKNEAIPGMVIGPIKGGFSVSLLAKTREEAEQGIGLRAFLPFSHVGLDNKMLPVLSDREAYLFKVRDFKPEEGNIIISRRSLLQKERREHEKGFWDRVQVGDVVSGVVKSLVPYGAFVDLAGADALLHVSDMSFEHHPIESERVKVGQALQVKILELDKKARKIKVGLKQLKKDPWQQIEDEYKVGMDITGTAVAFSDFGIFLHLAQGLEGLVHSSEISWQRAKHPSSYYKIGDEVQARILRLDKEGHRISLSIKALEENPIDKLAEKFPVGTVLKTKIVGIKEYGLFVQLDENMTGMVHIGELSWTRQVNHPSDLFKEGEEVEVAVLGFDTKRQRVSCSVKRTQPDPWIIWRSRYAKGTRHEVTVKRVSHNGFECELEPELTAFCSNKELGDMSAKQGQKLNVEVVACDPVQHRVSLSVKTRADKEAREDYDAYLQRSQGQNSKATLGDALGRLNN
ncbi:MAG: S1 RNA-binding domain-containing protein [Myxococcaceae bacterium]